MKKGMMMRLLALTLVLSAAVWPALAIETKTVGEDLPPSCIENLESPACGAFLNKAVMQLKEWKCRIQKQVDKNLDIKACVAKQKNASLLDLVGSVPEEVTIVSETVPEDISQTVPVSATDVVENARE